MNLLNILILVSFNISQIKILNRPLKIYNASAGSGKTYKLVQEYLQLLLQHKNGSYLSSISAMTFTNKAALEMKMRILSALEDIGYQEDLSNHVLANDIATTLNVSVQEVKNRCQFSLTKILHQYEDFFVETIDKFNVKLIRAFHRDLDLGSDLEIIINWKIFIQEVVEELFLEIGAKSNNEIKKTIINYSKSNLENEKSWNFEKDLLKICNTLASEKYSKIISEIPEVEDLKTRYNEAIAVIKKTNEEFTTIIKELVQFCSTYAPGIDSFKGKTRTSGQLRNLMNLKSIPDENPIKKTIENNIILNEEAPEQLKEIINKIETYSEENKYTFQKNKVFTHSYHNLVLLKFISSYIEKRKKETNAIHISEFNQLISSLVQGETAPYIYERLGNRYKHFLLDEFQDTSHLQWLNLVPLIHESLSVGNENLIVGDPKQSIYRFKNGIAEQFVDLPNIYNPENNPKIAELSRYFEQQGVVENLKDNWRSRKTIVEFNNFFFGQLKNSLPDISKEFFNSTYQHPQSEKIGLVDIHIKHTAEPDEDEYNNQLLKIIKECEEDNFKLNDICILVKTHNEGAMIAKTLNLNGYKFISSDTLTISNSHLATLTIKYFKWRANPSGINEKRQFIEAFLRMREIHPSKLMTYNETVESSNGKTFTRLNDRAFLNDYFGGYDSFFQNYQSLYELAQRFFDLCELEELKDPYLHLFADLCYRYDTVKGPDLDGFIAEYEAQKTKNKVDLLDVDDAIRIMTIHASKGLEFPVIIVPNINFSQNLKEEYITKLDDTVIHFNYHSKIPTKLTQLRELKDLEENQVRTDFINQIYVAFTRPQDRLYIFDFSKDKPTKNQDSLKKVITDVLKTNDQSVLDEEYLHLTIGERIPAVYEKNSSSLVLYTPKRITDKLWFPDIALQDMEILEDDEHLSKEKQFGIQFHLLMSQVDAIENAEKELDKLIQSGEIEALYKDDFLRKCSKLFSNETYAGFLNEFTEILNEKDIIIDENTILRPDKVIVKQDETIIIDFKTGLPSRSHHGQVLEYQSAFEEMSFPNVSCYLYYSSTDEIHQVF